MRRKENRIRRTRNRNLIFKREILKKKKIGKNKKTKRKKNERIYLIGQTRRKKVRRGKETP